MEGYIGVSVYVSNTTEAQLLSKLANASRRVIGAHIEDDSSIISSDDTGFEPVGQLRVIIKVDLVNHEAIDEALHAFDALAPQGPNGESAIKKIVIAHDLAVEIDHCDQELAGWYEGNPSACEIFQNT